MCAEIKRVVPNTTGNQATLMGRIEKHISTNFIGNTADVGNRMGK